MHGPLPKYMGHVFITYDAFACATYGVLICYKLENICCPHIEESKNISL